MPLAFLCGGSPTLSTRTSGGALILRSNWKGYTSNAHIQGSDKYGDCHTQGRDINYFGFEINDDTKESETIPTAKTDIRQYVIDLLNFENGKILQMTNYNELTVLQRLFFELKQYILFVGIDLGFHKLRHRRVQCIAKDLFVSNVYISKFGQYRAQRVYYGFCNEFPPNLCRFPLLSDTNDWIYYISLDCVAIHRRVQRREEKQTKENLRFAKRECHSIFSRQSLGL